MQIFKNKNFTCLFLATFISNLGSSIFNFVVGWYILEVTGSAVQMGTFLSIPYLIHVLFSPFIGVMCDRFDRKKIVVVTDAINALAMVLILFALKIDSYTTGWIYIFYLVNFILCFTDSFANIGTFTLKKECCKDDEFEKCNSLFAIQSNSRSILGSLVSGFMYKFLGMDLCIIYILCSYVVSTLAEAQIKIRHFSSTNDKFTVSTVKSSLLEGINYIKKREDIIKIFISAILFNITINPLCSVIIPYIVNSESLDVTTLSFIKVSMTIGSIFCSIYLMNREHISLTTFLDFFKYYALCFIVSGVSFYLFSSSIISTIVYIVLSLGCGFVVGIMTALFNVPFNTHIHSTVETEMVGRVYSLFSVVAHCLTPLSLVGSSFLIEKNVYYVYILAVFIIVFGIVLFKKTASHS